MKSVEQSKEAFISSEDTTFQIRSKMQGDRFQQLGSKGSKKVSKIMTNAKWNKKGNLKRQFLLMKPIKSFGSQALLLLKILK